MKFGLLLPECLRALCWNVIHSLIFELRDVLLINLISYLHFDYYGNQFTNKNKATLYEITVENNKGFVTCLLNCIEADGHTAPLL